MAQGWLVKRQISWPWGAQDGISLRDNRNFVRLFISESIRGIGHYFFIIALPWLVMETTGSATDMGGVLVVSGISRMGFMMVGGTLTDRYSPQRLILIGTLARAAMMALVTTLAFLGQASAPVLYLVSFGVGLTDALMIPAWGGVLPRLVAPEQLKAGNALLYGLSQFMALIGPAMAGFVIATVDNAAMYAAMAYQSRAALEGAALVEATGQHGAAAAFAINFLGLTISALLFTRVRLTPKPVEADIDLSDRPDPSQSASLKDLLVYLWRSQNLRLAFGMVYGVNLISSAPLWVGLPILAVTRFPQGAQALGLLTSALGCGSLLGSALAGLLPPPAQRRMNLIFLLAFGGVAGGLGLLNAVWQLELAVLCVLIVSSLVSYVNVIGVSHIQRETPSQYIGRMIGLLNMK